MRPSVFGVRDTTLFQLGCPPRELLPQLCVLQTERKLPGKSSRCCWRLEGGRDQCRGEMASTLQPTASTRETRLGSTIFTSDSPAKKVVSRRLLSEVFSTT